MGLIDFFKKIEPDKKKSPFMHTLYDAVFTLFYTPKTTTGPAGVQMRDGMDLKRLMVFVVLALQLCLLFGTYNIGHQHFAAAGMYPGFWDGWYLKLAHGLIKILPIFIVTHVVGLGIEIYYASKKGHGVEEGFLVTGALIPLIMPPDIPLWILAIAVAFAVIIGKEAFGGTGMNVWNVALLARVFIFFAYPTTISGDGVWVSGFESLAQGSQASYGWGHSFFNWLFSMFGADTFHETTTKIVDGFSGATPLALAAENGWNGVTAHFSPASIFWGSIPGSVGETAKPIIIFGALFLIITRVASWRIMIGALIGAVITALLFNLWGATPLMTVPWYYQLILGSFLFAATFMATDPVTAAGTPRGKWIYGILIGVFGMLIRVFNPAYPEGWMLAILFMNTFAALIDYYVIQGNIKKRLKGAK